MREAGISVVRIGEFSWSLLEPEPASYRWEWLDRAVKVMEVAGLELVLCTPTAAPPAWMIEKHPDILPVDDQGRRRRFGSRRHYCPTNPHYREFSRQIAAALAERYGSHSQVIGWQIDNEFGCYFARCYCPNCQAAFRTWLIAKYQTLDALNQAWGTVFWSQIYTSWDQVEPPNLTVAEPNPSHVLDYYRFASDVWVDYQQVQVNALKEVLPEDRFVTHNLIGSLTTVDYHHLVKDLDFISWDSYPTGYQETVAAQLYIPEEPPSCFSYDIGDPFLTGFFHALVRGLKQRSYWVMEQQTGSVNWSRTNTGVRSGALRLWTWQALMSGAEAVVYFRWRASHFGLEQHHAGLLRHDGEMDTGYTDLLKMKDEVDRMESVQSQRSPAPIAILLRYDDLWALEQQPHSPGFNYLGLLFLYFRACKKLGMNVDVIGPSGDFTPYQIVIAPSVHLQSQSLQIQLENFVDQGGTLLLGIRTGFKTETNLVTGNILPGAFRELTGVSVTSWQALPQQENFVVASSIDGFQGEAGCWLEQLHPLKDTISLAHYTSGPYQDQVGLTQHQYGDGRVLYLGFYPTEDQVRSLIAHLSEFHQIPIWPSCPSSMYCVLTRDELLLYNFTDQLQKVPDLKEVQVPPREMIILSKLGFEDGETK